MKKGPVFVLGNPRSGTTLLRLMLTRHRNIVIPPECGFVVWWHGKYGGWDSASTRDAARLEGFIRDLMTSRKIETWNLDAEGLRAYILGEQPSSYAELASCVYRFYGLSAGRALKRWGDKNNFHVGHVAEIAGLFPDASFVHIVRDGRDVACSYRAVMAAAIHSEYRPQLPTDIREIAAEWRANLLKVAVALAGVGRDRAVELRYEDLVSRPESELRRLCRFLDEPYESRMLAYHEANRRDRLEPEEFLQWKAKTLEEPTDSEVGKFRKDLPPEDVREFERLAGDILLRYDYALA